jgi:hypothetical protein
VAEVQRIPLVDGTDLIMVDADPDGDITAPVGSEAMLEDVSEKWLNTDGATEWVINDIHCTVRRNTTQTIPDGIATKIVMDNEWEDPAEMHDSGDITIPISGRYQVSGLVTYEPNGTGERTLRITKNGSTRYSVTVPGHASVAGSLQVSTIFGYSAGDVVRFELYQTSGGDLDVYGGSSLSRFQVTKL